MLCLFGYIIVVFSVLGGFMLAGGKPLVLLHVSEFVVIIGVSLGLMVVASTKEVLRSMLKDIKLCLKDNVVSRQMIIELMQLLYELLMLVRKNGLIALDEHVANPGKSAIFTKYSNILSQSELIEFIVNSFRPIIDGRVKPDHIGDLLERELSNRENCADKSTGVLNLVGDSLPGIGIIAAVLGIINTMNSIADGPEKVGIKVAAALTGTFLGIFGAYGLVNPLAHRIQSNHESQLMLLKIIATAIAESQKGVLPIMALEYARRQVDPALQPNAMELEEILKNSIKK